jgi:hypothetical protein
MAWNTFAMDRVFVFGFLGAVIPFSVMLIQMLGQNIQKTFDLILRFLIFLKNSLKISQTLNKKKTLNVYLENFFQFFEFKYSLR